jgi:tetratricopeptide (TPR) repeat protein
VEEVLYDRALVLFQQDRYPQAEELLRQALTQSPNSIACLHLLAEVLLVQDNPGEARQIIDTALGLAPQLDILYSTKARIMLDVGRYDDAEQLLIETINLNPSNADHFAMMGQITLSRKRYKEAEELATKALSLDPENTLALNTKATAQLKQNKREASEETLRGALGQNPEDSYTYANYGWNKLEQGDHKEALKYFQQSLRYNPNNPFAQSGMMQALQARYFFYRWFLRYQFWIGNMGAKYQWGFIIGFYLFTRVLNYVSDAVPTLTPYLTPIVILLALVALSTWIIGPLSQLLFRTNKYAKFLLSKKEKRATIFTAVCLVTFLGGLAAIFALNDWRFVSVAIAGLILMIPWSMFYMKTKPAYIIPAAAFIMTGIAAVAIYEVFNTGLLDSNFAIAFLVCFFAFQWLVNAVAIRRDNI